MKRIPVPNVVFFCAIGIIADSFNFIAIQSEIFIADSLFGATELQLGILGALASLGYALPAFATAMWSERVGRRPLCLLAFAGLAVAYLLMPHVQNVWQVCTVSFLRAMFTACLWPPLMAWMAELERHERLSRLLGWYNISWSGGILTGFYLAGLLFTYMGWKSGFYVPAGLAVLMFFFVGLCTPGGGSIPAGVEIEPDTVRTNPSRVQHFVRQGLTLMGLGMLVSSLVMYLFPKVGAGHVDEQGQSLLNTARMGGVMAAFIMMGRSHRWHYRQWPLWLCLGSLAIGPCLLYATNIYALYVAGFILIGFGFGISFMLSSFYALGLLDTKGKGSGMMETLIGSGGLIGPLFGGAIGSVTTPRIGILSGLVPVVLLGWLAAKQEKRGTGPGDVMNNKF